MIEKRWIVERTFGVLGRWGCLLRFRAGRLDVAGARLAGVVALSGVEAPADPKPILKSAA